MSRVLCFLISSLVLAAPSGAAVYMKSKVDGTGPNNRANEVVRMLLEGWFDGERAVIDILESNNPTLAKGRIYVDGTVMTLHDLEENTCTPWDMQAMMRFAGSVMESMKGIVELEFGEPELEILDRRSGESMLGRRVDYLKYRSDWTMSFKMPLVRKRTYDNSTVQEVWYDRALRDSLPSLGAFMDPESFSTGYEEMDEAIAAGMPPVEGAVLKSIAMSTMTNQKGKEETTTTVTEVTELDLSASDPAGGYSAPDDCKQVAMFPPTGEPPAGDEPQGEAAASDDKKKPWSKVKVGNPFKKKKKKDDG